MIALSKLDDKDALIEDLKGIIRILSKDRKLSHALIAILLEKFCGGKLIIDLGFEDRVDKEVSLKYCNGGKVIFTLVDKE